MPTLSVQLPGLPPVSHVLRDETTTIGRMKGSTIVIDDASVSLMHAKITRKDGEFFLKDLNSTNGTLVNGQVIREVRLQDLDQICFADIIGQFHAETAPSAAAPSLSLAATASTARPTIQSPRPSPAFALGSPQLARSLPATGFQSSRLINVSAAVVGGLALLVVASFVGWKLTRPNRETEVNNAMTKEPADFGSGVKRDQGSNPAASDVKQNPASAPVPASPDPGEPQSETVAQLVRALRDSNPVERRRAASLLHSLGTEAKEGIPALREALTDSDHEVQMWAALTLVNNRSYDKPAIPILVQALQHENATLRQVACLSLGIIPYENSEKQAVVPALTEIAMRDTNEEVRKAAVSALDIIAPEALAKAAKK